MTLLNTINTIHPPVGTARACIPRWVPPVADRSRRRYAAGAGPASAHALTVACEQMQALAPAWGLAQVGRALLAAAGKCSRSALSRSAALAAPP